MKKQIKTKARRIPEDIKRKFWDKANKEEREFMEKLGLKPDKDNEGECK